LGPGAPRPDLGSPAAGPDAGSWAPGPDPGSPTPGSAPAGPGEGPRVPRTLFGERMAARPVCVYALIAVNVFVYVFTASQARSIQYNSDAPLFEAWSLLPDEVWAGQWWRMLTSGFLHFGPLHLAVNMWSLWVIGKDFELWLGRNRFLGVYLLSLLGGSVFGLLFGAANMQLAGASGAVFGLMGGLTVVLHRLRLSLRPALIMIAINLVFSVAVPGISLAAHVGGLVVGAALTFVLLRGATHTRLR
jgi:membrane associated rhomboid family serine protease